jgi:hypothetical protein
LESSTHRVLPKLVDEGIGDLGEEEEVHAPILRPPRVGKVLEDQVDRLGARGHQVDHLHLLCNVASSRRE